MVPKMGRGCPRAKHESCRGRKSVAIAHAVILFKLRLICYSENSNESLHKGAVDSRTTGGGRAMQEKGRP